LTRFNAVILKEFPDIRWLKAQAAARFANRQGAGGITLPQEGWPSVILNTRTSNAVRDNIMGPLSIFTNLTGRSSITVDKKRAEVSPELFFISNSGQPYTLEIDQQQPTETFNIHFGERFTENALQSLIATQTQLLENDGTDSPFGFHNRIIPRSERFNDIVKSIQLDGNNNPLFLDEKLFELLSLLLREQGNVRAMAVHLEGLKSSTRQEIVKRLLCATDYLYTYYDKNPGLDELAQVSCLSKFHFLRLFKIAFGKTPHQFITELRIRKAKELLGTREHVQQIAHTVGFETASTFSRCFFREVGVYPSQFRALIRGI
jgi:AraC family transcriptional regulator